MLAVFFASSTVFFPEDFLDAPDSAVSARPVEPPAAVPGFYSFAPDTLIDSSMNLKLSTIVL